MHEDERIIPYFFQRAVDTERITLTPPRAGALTAPLPTRPLEHAVRDDSQIYLDCCWLIAQAYRVYTGCPASAWQRYWVAITWPLREP